MTQTPTGHPHVSLDDRGRPVITGTRMRLTMLVGFLEGPDGLTPETIPEAFPHLTAEQVAAALAYVAAHRAEIDRRVAEEEAETNRLLALVVDPVRQADLARRAAEWRTERPAAS
jgi:uncharacterized protein (DUF433 family)